MARYRGPVCRLCRREGVKLLLKGTKCETAKCHFERRSFAPGQHGQRRTKLSEYGVQLREKQKLRRMWGMLEKQFNLYFQRSAKLKGITGDNLLRSLELRLDNVTYRLGFSNSRTGARQLVSHGHVEVDGRKVNIPSYALKEGQVIKVSEKANIRKLVQTNLEITSGRPVPGWLMCNQEGMEGKILKVPTREEISVPVNEQLIVELYSK